MFWVSLWQTCTHPAAAIKDDRTSQAVYLWFVSGEYLSKSSGDNKVISICCKEEIMQQGIESRSKHSAIQQSFIQFLCHIVSSKTTGPITQTLLQSPSEYLQYRFHWIPSSIPNHCPIFLQDMKINIQWIGQERSQKNGGQRKITLKHTGILKHMSVMSKVGSPECRIRICKGK